MAKKIIYGCESRGDAQTPYLTRYTLLDLGWLQVCLHVFHRSDSDEMHDHPWPFVSLPLWRGYIEESRCTFEEWERTVRLEADGRQNRQTSGSIRSTYFARRRRVWPGMLLLRRASHAHRVELVDGKPAVTLVFMGRKSRNWGFFTNKGWQRWTEYFRERGCR